MAERMSFASVPFDQEPGVSILLSTMNILAYYFLVLGSCTLSRNPFSPSYVGLGMSLSKADELLIGSKLGNSWVTSSMSEFFVLVN